MTNLDFGFILLTIASVFWGMYKGFIGDFLSTLVWIFALYIAYVLGDDMATYFPKSIFSKTVSLSLAYIVIALFTLLVCFKVINVLRLLFGLIGGGGIDSLAGIAFGLARAGFAILLFIFLANPTDISKQEFWKESVFVKRLLPYAMKLRDYLPENTEFLVKDKMDEMSKTIHITLPPPSGSDI